MLNFNYSIKNFDDSRMSLIQFMSDRPVYWLCLTTFCAYANTRGRSWPDIETVAFQATKKNQNIAVEAKKWLVEHQAMVLVPREKRVGLELKLDPRKHVYQMTGYIVSDEGHVYEYTWMNDTDWEEIRESLKDLGVPSLEEKRIQLSEAHMQKLREKQERELATTEKDRKDKNDAIKSKIRSSKDSATVSTNLLDMLGEVNKAIEWEEKFESELPDIIEKIRNQPATDDEIIDYGEDEYKESSLEDFDKIEGAGNKDTKELIRNVRNFIMANWKELSSAYGTATRMAKQMLGVSPKKDGAYYDYRFAIPVTLEELEEFKNWWNIHRVDDQTEKPLHFPQRPEAVETNFSDFRSRQNEKNTNKQPRTYDKLDMSDWK